MPPERGVTWGKRGERESRGKGEEHPGCTRCAVDRKEGKGEWARFTQTQPADHQPRREPQPAAPRASTPHPGRWAEPSGEPAAATRPSWAVSPEARDQFLFPLAAELGRFEPKPQNQLLFLFFFQIYNLLK